MPAADAQAQIATTEIEKDLVELRLGPVTLVAPKTHQGEAEALLERSPVLLERLQTDLRHRLAAPVTIALIPRPVPDLLRDLDRAGTAWAAGFLFPVERVGAIRLDRVTKYPFDGTEMVFVHELTHQFLHDKVGRSVPRWFDEAVATQEGRRRGTRDFLLFTSTTLTTRVPPLASLDRAFQGSEQAASRAYAVSFEFLSWATRKYGKDFATEVLDATARRLQQPPQPLDARTPFEAAWQEVATVPLLISEQQWRDSGFRWTRWLPVLLTSNWLWVAMALLAFLAFLTKRRQKIEQYKRWEEDEFEAAKPVPARASALGPLVAMENFDAGQEVEVEEDETEDEPVN